MGKVDPLHPDLAADPLGILRPNSKLVHQLPLVIYHLLPLGSDDTAESPFFFSLDFW